MKFSKSIQLSMVAVLFLGIAAYIVYAMAAMSDGDKEEKCKDLVLNIEDAENADFINRESVEKLLHNNNIYIKGELLKDINVRRIEQVLKQDQFIDNVQCYKTANGKVTINIHQRTPVLYILPGNQDGYYIDANGEIIRNTDYPINLPVATGCISQKYASSCLALLGSYLAENPFWNNQIEQIYVSINHDKRYSIDLVPRVGQQNIHLGSINNFQRKLERLSIFYKKAMTSIGWNKYSSINLEYDNQIICKKTN